MKTEICPDRNTLEKLLLGDLPADQRESLGEHLMNCEKCAETAETLALSDELTAAIRTGRVFDEDDEILAEVIKRGKQLNSEIETVESLATVVVSRRTENEARSNLSPDTKKSPAIAEEEYDFLDPPEEDDEIGRLGGYRVLEVMGAGGMGVVFRAEDPKLKRLVALKAMKPAVAASRSARDRFIQEAQATASIEHDNIVQIYQVDEDHTIPFIAMRFLRGESLQTLLNRETQLDQQDAVRIGREVAAGLAAAHQRNLIHRDIKPDNIWIEAETGRAKILDFGLVRNVSEDGGLTQSGMVLGTPRYMAAEQAQGQELDYRCDLFSLGSVLYHLVAGRAPFEGANLTATLMAVAHQDPVPVAEVVPGLHPGLAKLITQLLCKDREQRPQSASEVVTALATIETQLESGEIPEVEETDENTVITQPVPDPGTTVAEREPVPIIKTADDGHRKPPRRKTALWMWGSFAALLLLGVITFSTAKGTVTVKLPGDVPDDVEVKVLGEHDVVEVLSQKNNWSVRLAGGQYTLQVAGGDDQFQLRDNTLTVTRFGRSIVHMTYDEKKAAVESTTGTVPSSAVPSGNYALEFDGEDDYVEIPSLKYDGSHPLTIEAWVRPERIHSGFINLIARVTGSNAVSLYAKDAEWRTMNLANQRGPGVTTSAGEDLHHVTHVAATVKGAEISLFVDGQKVEQLPGPFQGTAELHQMASSIGGSFWNKSMEPFQGLIDEVRISRTVRYSRDFRPAARFKNDPDTIALYHFDGQERGIVVDASGNGHHGVIHGARRVALQGPRIPEEENASPARRIPTREWIDLLAVADPQLDVPRAPVSGGNWQTIDGTLHAPIGRYVRIGFPVVTTSSYQISAEFTRKAGADSCNFYLPVGSRQVQFVVDGFGGKGLSGLQSVKLVNEPTPGITGIDQFRLENGRRYAIEITVKIEGDRATIDATIVGSEEHTITWTGAVTDLSLFLSDFALNDSRQLGLGAWMSEYVFHKYEFRSLEEGAQWTRAVSEPSSRDRSGNYSLQFDGKDDYVELPQIPLPTQTADDAFTIEGWVLLPETLEHNALVFNIGDAAKLHADPPRVEGGKWRPSLRGPGMPGTVMPRAREMSPAKRFVHVALVWNGKSFDFYLDGVRDVRQQEFRAPVREVIKEGFLGVTSPTAQDFLRGSLDEFRISNVARYDQDFTPAKRFDPDEHTLALYHFDEGEGEVLTDDSGNGYDGKIVGAKWVKVDGTMLEPKQNYALEFDGIDDLVEIEGLALPSDEPTDSFTVEVWIQMQNRPREAKAIMSVDGESIFFHCDPPDKEGGRYRGTIKSADGTGVGFFGADGPEIDRFAHLAIVWQKDGANFFVNGRRSGGWVKAAAPLLKKPGSKTLLGGLVPGHNMFHGILDEARVSNTARYTEDFTPAKRFENDEHTLALYHFDEGSGDVLKDASGHGHHGKVHGAKWVRVDNQVGVIEGLQQDYALSFDGKDDYVYGMGRQLDLAEPFTIEVRVSAPAQPVDRDGSMNIIGNQQFGIRLTFQHKHWHFFLRETPLYSPINESLTRDPPRSVHLVLQSDGSQLRCFVDGKSAGVEMISPPSIKSMAALGADFTKSEAGIPTETDNHFHGLIDEVRISDIARYENDFAPATRFEPDEHTLALYHFDEGKGDVVKDASGNGHDGKIVGAKWILKDRGHKAERVLPTEPNRASTIQAEPKSNPEVPLRALKPLKETTDE